MEVLMLNINGVFINENLWLTQKSIAELFNVKVQAISKDSLGAMK